MTTSEYMKELSKHLRKLPKEEKEEALQYYTDYFADAGPANAEAVMKELGTPKDIAKQVILECAMKNTDTQNSSAKKSLSTLWIVLLAIAITFSPIALMCILVIIFVVFAIFITLFFTMLSGVIAAFASILWLVFGIILATEHLGNGLFLAGTGAIACGLSILLTLATAKISKLLLSLITKLFRKLIKGGKES